MSIFKNKKILAVCIPVVCVLVAFFILLPTVFIPNGKYKAAVALYNEGKYEEAIEAFEALGGYRDSEEQIEKCRTAIYDASYAEAIALMNAGKYEEAIEIFLTLDGYLDSEAQIAACRRGILKNSKVGDVILYGTYEQDNSTESKEQIEWIVVQKDGDKLLLVSRYALDTQPYNTVYQDVTWETSSLRSWLNGEFLSSAFSESEQNLISVTEVKTEKNTYYDTNAGNNVNDKVFILSATEAESYFKGYSARKCIPTPYAASKGTFTNENYAENGGSAPCWWWVRTQGESAVCACDVDYDGSVLYSGNNVNTAGGGVRPAMWIDLGN